VVRLKSGDPMIFGRAGEEIAALERAEIPVEIVPGVTAAQGAAASLRVSLTQRTSARRVQFITGHAHDGRLPEDLDLAALCDPSATTAVYMPLGTLRDLSVRLLAEGINPGWPMTAVFNATRADQHIVSATVATIADRVDAQEVIGPCVVLIGEVLRPPATLRASVPAGAASVPAMLGAQQ
jgi:uroporphyrin-III C-methyltransferase/precorrin-2 dehydrogenase/sirohydrochlorin ferrochelatase